MPKSPFDILDPQTGGNGILPFIDTLRQPAQLYAHMLDFHVFLLQLLTNVLVLLPVADEALIQATGDPAEPTPVFFPLRPPSFVFRQSCRVVFPAFSFPVRSCPHRNPYVRRKRWQGRQKAICMRTTTNPHVIRVMRVPLQTGAVRGNFRRSRETIPPAPARGTSPVGKK